MRYRPGLKGSIFWFIFAFILIFISTDKETYLYCSINTNFCYKKSVSNFGYARDKKLIPISEIKSVEYKVKPVGKYKDHSDGYVGTIYMTQKNGACTFEVYREYSKSETDLTKKIITLANEIKTQLGNNQNEILIPLTNSREKKWRYVTFP